jgi:hypothetical protein
MEQKTIGPRFIWSAGSDLGSLSIICGRIRGLLLQFYADMI